MISDAKPALHTPRNLPDGMHEGRTIQRVLVTGASGYLGRSLCEVLAGDFGLLRMDITEVPGPGAFLSASVTDRNALNEACREVDALVLAHMAPSRSDAYDWPDLGLDVNVKGVALALEAAARHNIRRVALISSISVVSGHEHDRAYLTCELSHYPVNLYGLTKALQEDIAWYYHRQRGLEIAILRPAYILREDSLVNKYGEKRALVTWHCVDPRDIGRATASALKLEGLKYEKFFLISGPDAEKHADLAPARERLGWKPEFRFEGIPIEELV